MWRKLIVGVALIAAAVGSCIYAERWIRTTGPVAIEEPLSLNPGHVSARFLAGYNARYCAGIEFGAEQELLFAKPNCVPLPNYSPEDCSGIPAGLNISWTLINGRQVIKRGSAETTIWRVSGSPFLGFGTFHLEGGRCYRLDVEIMNDGSRLAPAQPRLSVHVFQAEFAETSGLGTRALLIKVFTRIGYGLCALIGLGLVFSAFRSRDRESPKS